jgi:wobble nucleotide-excising tRNase
VSVEPTLINFLFGNNGTGKTTIAKAIAADEGLTFEQGRSFDAYSVLVYNQGFIDRTLQRFGNLPGVYTIGEENVGIQNQIEEATRKKGEAEARWKTATDERGRKETAKDSLLASFQGACWDKTKAERDEFAETQVGKKQKATFAEEILRTTTPTQHDLTVLRTLYETAYDANAQQYRGFELLGGVTRLKNSGGNTLMGKVITSSGDSPFAEFIKAIDATSWVRQGHEHFTQTADGKCPYCQQPLPDDFEDNLAACFDGQYQQDIDELVQFKEDYAADMLGFIEVLKGNLEGDVYPKLDLTEYKDKLTLLEQAININLQRIADKIKEPSSTPQLEDVKTLRTELNDIMVAFNKLIEQNNDVVKTKTAKKNECKRMVWELLAFMLKDEVARYHDSKKALESEIADLTTKINADRQTTRELQTEITDLNGRIVSTLPTITDINNRLRDSGFQGFSIRENEAQEGTYQIIRENGDPADNLSEGEKNFIAFLYFYHNVRGGQDSGDLGKPKIVVIDDPVSSMDSSVLFIVSTLVREMIEVCHNNLRLPPWQVPGDYIKQLFILTHNAYFHKVITYNKVPHYNCVSFFVVKKTANASSVSLCEKKKYPFERDTEMENQNPVKNSYAALWDEYKEVDTAIPLLNVIFRILDYYFLQICGHDGDNIHKLVLTDHRDRFVDIQPNGAEDLTKFHLASAMLSYLGSHAAGMGDGLHYIDDCTDMEQYKAVFKLIFAALDQEQHYKMMMGENANNLQENEE